MLDRLAEDISIAIGHEEESSIWLTVCQRPHIDGHTVGSFVPSIKTGIPDLVGSIKGIW